MLVARAAGSSKFPNSDFSYIILYTPSTDHIQHYNMSYSEGDDESGDSSTDVDAKSDGDGSTAGASLSDSP